MVGISKFVVMDEEDDNIQTWKESEL